MTEQCEEGFQNRTVAGADGTSQRVLRGHLKNGKLRSMRTITAASESDLVIAR
jgi:hypothetical protein